MLDSSGNGKTLTQVGTISNVTGIVTNQAKSKSGSGNVLNAPILETFSNFTVSFWLKRNNDISTYGHPYGGLGSVYFHIGENIPRWHVNASWRDVIGKKQVPLNEWHLLTTTYDASVGFKHYVDGILDAESKDEANKNLMFVTPSVRIFDTNADGSYSTASFDINDFRIYDHALSTKEIIELAKAKILHLTFDDVVEPTVNYIPDGSFINKTAQVPYLGNCYQGSLAFATGDDNTPCEGNILEYTSTGTSSYMDNYMGAGSKLATAAEGDVFTVSAYFKSKTGVAISGRLRLFPMNSSYGYISAPSVVVNANGSWQRVEFSFTMPAGTIGVSVRMDNYTPGGVLQINGWQLEKKPKATNFVNGTRATAVVADKSDYFNDASVDLATTPFFTDDCKIGRKCSRFEGTKKIALVTTLFDMPTLKPITVSAWIRPTSTGNYMHIASNRKASTSFDWLFFLHISDNALCFHGTGQNKSSYIPPLNQWTHVVATVDSSGLLKLYANGIKVYEISGYQPYGGVSGGQLVIGHDGYSNENFKGDIDDVRIYATALTAAQVKELCEVRGSIDNKGNLFVGNLNIDSTLVGAARIDKKGFFNCKKISDHGVVDGLVAWYPLDGDAKDYAGTNHGVVTGAVVASGQGQKCYSFDGVDDYIEVADKLAGVKAITISAWSNASKGIHIYGNHVPGIDYPNVQISRGHFVVNGANNSTYAYGVVNNPVVPSDGLYHHYCGVYDNVGKTIKYYMDGVLTAIAAITELCIPYVSANKPRIGAEDPRGNASASQSSALQGKIQDIRIYNRALTQEEVKINYDITRPDGPRMKVSKSGTVYIKGKIKNNI